MDLSQSPSAARLGWRGRYDTQLETLIDAACTRRYALIAPAIRLFASWHGRRRVAAVA